MHDRPAEEGFRESGPGFPGISRAEEQASSGTSPIAARIGADVQIVIPADRVDKVEAVDRPLQRVGAPQDRIVQKSAEGIERRVSKDWMTQPVVDMRSADEVRW